jgi:uncharacterized protein YukE
MGVFGDPQSINDLVGVLDSIQANTTGIHDDLDGRVVGLVPTHWDGLAANAFVGHWDRQKVSVFELIRVCGRMARVLDQLATELDRANRLAEQAGAAAATTGMSIDAAGHTFPSNPVLAARIGLPGYDPAAEAHAQVLMEQARQVVQTAWNEALADLSPLGVPQIDPSVTVDNAKHWVDQEVLGADHRSFWDKLRSDGLTDIANVIEGGLAMAGGAGLVALGGGGEVGGVALDATGVLAIAGVPVNVLSAGVIVTGGAVAIGGAVLAGNGLGDLIAMARSRSGRTGGKEGATNAPSWAKGEAPKVGESGKDYAKRLLDERYGEGNYDTGPRSEYNKLKKYGDRHFKPR